VVRVGKSAGTNAVKKRQTQGGSVTSDGFTHRPNRPWPRAPRNSFPWRLNIN